MGVCINIFGFPVVEDKDCAAKRRAQALVRNEQNNERKVENTYNRNEQQLGSSIARNYGTSENGGGFTSQAFGFLGDAVSGGNALVGDVFGSGGAGSTIAGAYLTGGTSLLGGLGGLFGGTDPATGAPIPPSPLLPVLGLAAIAAIAYAATR